MNSNDDVMSDIQMEMVDVMSDISMIDIPMKMVDAMSSYIPMEMVGEILSRLPAKSLMRFSCVSKEWYDLINNNIDFLKKHLIQVKAKKKSSCSQTLRLGDPVTIYCIDIDLLDAGRLLVHTLVELKPPFSDTSYIYNYCNGLIVVVSGRQNNLLTIWNPFTRKYKTLPPPPPVDCLYDGLYDCPRCRINQVIQIRYGLVYDSVHDDYKVLMSVNVARDHSRCVFRDPSRARIYSLKSNSWKVIMNCPTYDRWDILVHGALHELSHKLIICFDFAAEERYEILLPEGLEHYVVRLFALQGLLGFSCRNHSTIDFWIMNEYRVEESWVKLLSLTPPTGDRFVYPISYSDNGRKVLLLSKYNELIWFDLECKTYQVDIINRRWTDLYPDAFQAEVCVETLISPDGYGENENKCWINLQQEEEEE